MGTIRKNLNFTLTSQYAHFTRMQPEFMKIWILNSEYSEILSKINLKNTLFGLH